MRLLILFIAPLLLAGCVKMNMHPYDGRIEGEKDINRKNIARIEEACAGKDTIRFVFTGDTQGRYDDTDAFKNAVNQRNDIDFVIHGGDISDFGITREFTWMRDILNKLTVPYVVIIGNHDFLANGEEVFNAIFGANNFAFTAGFIRFINLNTNALEADYSKPVPDFGFIENETDHFPGGASKTIVAMHAPPYSDQFNNNVARVFQSSIRQFPGLLFAMHAHTHNYSREAIYNDGIYYYGTPGIGKRSYLVFTITENSQTHELVEF